VADLSDVTNTLATLATAALYPAGTAQPSVVGVTITTASGWPEPKQLDAILAAGNAMLTVYPVDGTETNTTRFLAQMEPLTAIPAAQLSLTVTGNRITVGGSIKAGEAATISVNYKAVSYGVQASDTVATVAAALAAMTAGATASGAVITVSGAFDIAATVSVPVAMQAEIARQTRLFMLSAWCPTPAIRDLMAPAVDLNLKCMPRITLPDNTLARLIYRGTLETDYLAKQRIYRRDLRYEVEYVTTATETDNTVSKLATGIAPTAGSTFTINI
jgi:hypothetical protein